MHFKGCEFTVDHFAINDDRFKVSEFVKQFTFLVLATKEVDSFLNRVALKVQENDEPLKKLAEFDNLPLPEEVARSAA